MKKHRFGNFPSDKHRHDLVRLGLASWWLPYRPLDIAWEKTGIPASEVKNLKSSPVLMET